MKVLKSLVHGLLALTLVAGTSFGGVVGSGQDEQPADAPETPPAATAASNEEPASDAPGESAQAEVVEGDVQDVTDEATARRRKEILTDAVEALAETRKALKALENGETEAALESLALATGKLDLVVARNPRLALAPIDVRLVTHDLYATVESVEEVREQALDLLKEGRLQDARVLMEGLRSEVVVEVVTLPLATYPAAIQAISPLIDEDRIDAAKAGLQRALNTLVVTRHVLPLPVLRAERMLARADELATTEGRTEEQNENLTRLIEGARTQLELAQALGYGEEDDYVGFYAQLDEITGKTEGGKSGTGFFDRIKSKLRSFARSSSNTQ